MIFKINPAEDYRLTTRLVAATTISTAILGLLGFYTTVFVFKLIQRNTILEVTMLVGSLNGAVAGYSTSILWKKYLKNIQF